MLIKFKMLGARDVEEGADGGAGGPRPWPLADAANARTAAKIAAAAGLLSLGAAVAGRTVAARRREGGEGGGAGAAIVAVEVPPPEGPHPRKMGVPRYCPFPTNCERDDQCASYYPLAHWADYFCDRSGNFASGHCVFQAFEVGCTGDDECTKGPTGVGDGDFEAWCRFECVYAWCLTDPTDAGGPYFGVAGSPVEFGGYAPSDPYGSTLTYTWDFGDGSSGEGENVNHAYAEAGEYHVRLEVTNGGGATGTDSATATVSATGPYFTTTTTSAAATTTLPYFGPRDTDANGPYFGLAGLPVEFGGSALSDPDGHALTYAWDFGDGNSGTGENATHTYAKAGEYDVKLEVTKGDSSATGTAFAKVTVKADNKDPVAVIATKVTEVDAPLMVLFDGSGSYDPDYDEPLTYVWFFDDGSDPGTDKITNRTYAEAGTYRVELAVSDSYGGTDTAIANVTVDSPVK